MPYNTEGLHSIKEFWDDFKKGALVENADPDFEKYVRFVFYFGAIAGVSLVSRNVPNYTQFKNEPQMAKLCDEMMAFGSAVELNSLMTRMKEGAP